MLQGLMTDDGTERPARSGTGLDLGKSTLVGSGDLPNMPLAVAMGRSSKPHAGRGCPQWETEERQNFELTDCCM